MSLVKQMAQKLYELTKDRPMILHMDAIGFLHFGENEGKNIQEIIDNKLEKFNQVLNVAQELGANILIPTFSYSIKDGKLDYDVKESVSEVGAATEFFRKKNLEKRTKDPIFSYLLFSNNEDLKQDLKVKDFNTFGENSIIDKVYKMNGFIGSIGDVIWRTTEAHYLEKKLDVSYRFDKTFKGNIKDIDNKEYDIKTIFFCRKLDIGLAAHFKPIVNDLRSQNLVRNICLKNFCIEYFFIQELYKMMQNKYKENSLYFTREDDGS